MNQLLPTDKYPTWSRDTEVKSRPERVCDVNIARNDSTSRLGRARQIVTFYICHGIVTPVEGRDGKRRTRKQLNGTTSTQTERREVGRSNRTSVCDVRTPEVETYIWRG